MSQHKNKQARRKEKLYDPRIGPRASRRNPRFSRFALMAGETRDPISWIVLSICLGDGEDLGSSYVNPLYQPERSLNVASHDSKIRNPFV